MKKLDSLLNLVNIQETPGHIVNVDEIFARNLVGSEGYDTSNGTCGGTNNSCENTSCAGSSNTTCSNAACLEEEFSL